MERNVSKIAPMHLAKKAIIYVRQSSEKQVQNNLESQRRQYALVERAKQLGWRQVEVIDEDLGQSAALAGNRAGFDRMVAAVALGEVGIIFSLELARLSRNDQDWCRLLEVCRLLGTLVADADHIYDLKNPDDQLIVGIKGTLSVMELNLLKGRLLDGAEAKARRGQLQRLLTPGYVYDPEGQIVKDPDTRVQHAIGLVFKKFPDVCSIRQLFKWFCDEGLEMPVNKFVNRKRKLCWQAPTLGYIAALLHNPFYAGAYAYGRRQTELRLKAGQVVKRVGKFLALEEWKVLIKDHHEGYISWPEYQENLRRMRRSCLNLKSEEVVATIRAGQGLLVGLLRCGRCGRKLHVRYWGARGTNARYLCKGDFDAGGKYCLGFGGATVDKRFGQELMKALSPLTLAASIQAWEELGREQEEKQVALEKKLQQLDYEARRAFEQYNEVDPRNRLVASELEKRWNDKLEAVEKVRLEIADVGKSHKSLSEQDRKKILSLGERFDQVWESELCSVEWKKKIIRALVEEIIVNVDEERKWLKFVIHWKGGTHTAWEMEKPKSAAERKTAMEDLELVRRMAFRYPDAEIARTLNKLGRTTAKGHRWSAQSVKTVRVRYQIKGAPAWPRAENIFTLGEAAKYCGVSQTTIKKLAAHGLLKYGQIAPFAPWEIQKEDLDGEPICSIVAYLKRTGKLILEGVGLEKQKELFQ